MQSDDLINLSYQIKYCILKFHEDIQQDVSKITFYNFFAGIKGLVLVDVLNLSPKYELDWT